MEGIGPDFPPGIAWRTWLLRSLSMLGAFDEAGALVDELGVLGGDRSDVTTHGYIVANGCIGSFHLARGELGRAMAQLEPTIERSRRVDAILLLAFVAGPLGATYVLAGRAPEAISLLEDVLERARADQYSLLVDDLEIRLGEAYLSAGRLAEADRALTGALRHARTTKARGTEAEALRALGNLAQGGPAPDFNAAASHIEAAADLAEQLGMRPLGARCALELGGVRHLQGRRDEARALLGRAAGQFREMGMAFWRGRAETAILSLG
jgi:tetratricopeptide (TPR) repeat protein